MTLSSSVTITFGQARGDKNGSSGFREEAFVGELLVALFGCFWFILRVVNRNHIGAMKSFRDVHTLILVLFVRFLGPSCADFGLYQHVS